MPSVSRKPAQIVFERAFLLYGMNDEELKAIDELFTLLGLDEEATEAVTLVGNTTFWAEITNTPPLDSPPFEHHWDTTLPHFWSEDELWEAEPFVGEEWMRYDPREGF